jgi:arginine repressor
MKKFALLLSVVFAAGLAYAHDEKAATAAEKGSAKTAATSHIVSAEVVSVDTANNTITLKTEKGETTAPVQGKAVAALKNVKAGEKVTVTCKDENGQHKAVTSIKAAAAAKPATPEKN